MGYSIASGEIKQIGAAAVTNGITEAGTMEIGGKTLHDVSYNERIAAGIKAGERIALLLTPTGFVAALRRQNGETIYASDEGQAHLEKPMPYPFYIFMGTLGLLTTFAGIGLIIILWVIKAYMARKDIVQSMDAFRLAAL